MFVSLKKYKKILLLRTLYKICSSPKKVTRDLLIAKIVGQLAKPPHFHSELCTIIFLPNSFCQVTAKLFFKKSECTFVLFSTTFYRLAHMSRIFSIFSECKNNYFQDRNLNVKPNKSLINCYTRKLMQVIFYNENNSTIMFKSKFQYKAYYF